MRWLITLIILLLLLILATPVHAFDIPTQGTDNATDNVLWHADTANISILNGTITITGLETALTNSMEGAADEIADQLGTISLIWAVLAFLFGMAFLAYCGKDRLLFLVAGLGFFIEGFTFISTKIELCILMVLAGVFILIRVFSKKGLMS